MIKVISDIQNNTFIVGDNIAITFTGIILETDPGQIQQVEVIQLLGDEKYFMCIPFFVMGHYNQNSREPLT